MRIRSSRPIPTDQRRRANTDTVAKVSAYRDRLCSANIYVEMAITAANLKRTAPRGSRADARGRVSGLKSAWQGIGRRHYRRQLRADPEPNDRSSYLIPAETNAPA